MRVMLLCAGLLVAVSACQKQEEAKAEPKLPEIVPDIPKVPTLPPPPHPITYEDESHSVFGIRHRLRHTMDTDSAVTGYIVEIYEPPKCTEKKKEDCPKPAAPHMWLADTPDETKRPDQLLVVGYADNQEQLDKAKRRSKPLIIGMDIAVPRDLAVGNKVKVNGRFTRISSGGFNTSNGLLDYKTHETLSKAGK